MVTRKTDWINNFWKALAHDPATLKRTWEDIKQIMAPGALDPPCQGTALRSLSASATSAIIASLLIPLQPEKRE